MPCVLRRPGFGNSMLHGLPFLTQRNLRLYIMVWGCGLHHASERDKQHNRISSGKRCSRNPSYDLPESGQLLLFSPSSLLVKHPSSPERVSFDDRSFELITLVVETFGASVRVEMNW